MGTSGRRPVRVAVIGVGSLGQHHARIYAGLEEADLVAVVDADPDRAASVASRHGVPALSSLTDLPRDLEAALERLSREIPDTPEVKALADFIRGSQRGVIR